MSISHKHVVAMRCVVHVASIIPIRLVRSRLTKAGFPYVAEDTSPRQFTRSEYIRCVYVGARTYNMDKTYSY